MKRSSGLARAHATLAVASTVVFFGVEAWARAGGGGGGSGGRGPGPVSMIISAIAIMYALYMNVRISRRSREINEFLDKLRKTEPEGTKENLLRIVDWKFRALQKAWGDQDLDSMKAHLHPSFYPSWEAQIKEQAARGERNVMSDLSIQNIRIVSVQNFTDDERDCFTVCFDARAKDQILRGDTVVSSDNSAFREFWVFERENDQWLVRDIHQAEKWRKVLALPIINVPSWNRKAG